MLEIAKEGVVFSFFLFSRQLPLSLKPNSFYKLSYMRKLETWSSPVGFFCTRKEPREARGGPPHLTQSDVNFRRAFTNSVEQSSERGPNASRTFVGPEVCPNVLGCFGARGGDFTSPPSFQ